MTGKTKNKLTFSKKKTGVVKKKQRPEATPSTLSPASARSPAPAQPVPAHSPAAAPTPPPVAASAPAPPARPKPPVVEGYASQPTEHASQIPTAQPVGAPPPPPPRPSAPAPPVAAPVAATVLKTSSPPPVGASVSRAPAGKSELRGRPVPQPAKSSNVPSNFKETEDLKEQVGNYLEICDSCLQGDYAPTDIIDLIHVLVMSLRLDVVSMALIDPALKGKFSRVVSRGYELPPTSDVVECWEFALTVKNELLWDKLMNVATDKKTELAYWIVKENLDSVGYVPIRDGKRLYGFLFVASKSQKEHSIVKSELLEACGSRLGLAYAELYTP
ncbi:MAG: hypothetical protein GXP32_05455 [Kiritimatiellaeota bacterium]|nr:hypothetical protein [Kiritimatiellota bacterium]